MFLGLAFLYVSACCGAAHNTIPRAKPLANAGGFVTVLQSKCAGRPHLPKEIDKIEGGDLVLEYVNVKNNEKGQCILITTVADSQRCRFIAEFGSSSAVYPQHKLTCCVNCVDFFSF